MKWTPITGNGQFKLTDSVGVNQTSISVYAPAVIGATTCELGYLDSLGVFVALTDGDLLTNAQVLVRSGFSLDLILNVAGFTAGFKVGTSKSHN